MSNVIAFRADRKMPPRTLLPSEKPQILLFTGIRYIREDEAAVPHQPPPCAPLPRPLADDRLQA